ncbi:BrnT family toxin [Bdellovibrio sp. HCB288]|uniref:BrnT family toxin n=1 Tax=Bdellovibrio sp. HCB288 TaxID=3394355 RepID=UPI0039B4EA1A
MRFTWDDDKNTANQKKHGISFEEAISIFDGTEEIEFDSEHSTEDEERYLAFGRIENRGAVVVVFCEIVDDVIRIISARKG